MPEGAASYLPETDPEPKGTPFQDLYAKAKAKYEAQRPKPTQQELNLEGMSYFLQMKAWQMQKPRRQPTHRAPLPYARMKWWKSRRRDRFRANWKEEIS
jgi:hypothetical protein